MLGERFAWFYHPHQHKGRNPLAFLSAYTDVRQKGERLDLKAVSGQTSKIESDFIIIIVILKRNSEKMRMEL